MTEERPASNSISVLHSMLNRLKSSEKLHGSSHATAQHFRHSKDINHCDSVFSLESDKPEWNSASSNPLECSVKPGGQSDTDKESEYFTQRTVIQEPSPASTTISKNGRPPNFLHDLIEDGREDLQSSKSNTSLEEVIEEHTSQAESHASILKNNPPHGSFMHVPTGSCLSNSKPCWTEDTVMSVEEPESSSFAPELQNLDKVHVNLQRTVSLKDFKLNLEPISLLEEICTGEQWAKFLNFEDSPLQSDATKSSQTKDSRQPNFIGSQDAVIKPDLSAGKEQSGISYNPESITGHQMIYTGEEWAKFLHVEDSPPQTASTDYSKTEDSHQSNVIGSQDAVIKPDLSAGKEQSEISYSPENITGHQVIYTGEEWAKFLHVEDSPPQTDSTDYSQIDVSYQSNDIRSQDAFIKPDLSAGKDQSEISYSPESITGHQEICTGEELPKLLHVEDSQPQTDTTDYSHTDDSPQSNYIRYQDAVIKPDLSADKEQSEFSYSPESITGHQVDSVAQVKHETADSSILALPKTVTQMTPDLPHYEEVEGNENELVYMYDRNNLTEVEDMPLDASFVKESGVLDNSALNSQTQLSQKRNHQTPGNINMGFLQQDSQTVVLNNKKMLERNATELQMTSEESKSYNNDNDNDKVPYESDHRSNQATLTDVPLDFSVVKSSGILDNSALKNRIQLSKKRKHRPPGKNNNEIPKMKFSPMNFIRQRNAPTESVWSHHSSEPSVSSSSTFYNVPMSQDSNDSQTPVPGTKK
ncbi:titin isoform X2, partial [Clarias magur]